MKCPNFCIPVFEFLILDTVDLISKIFQRNPADRISLSGILGHPWVVSLQESQIQVTASTSASRLGISIKEMALAAKLESAGFDIQKILEAVHTNACNQSAALWHLLLEKLSNVSPSYSALSSPLSINHSNSFSDTCSPSTGKPSIRINISQNKVGELFEGSQLAPAYSATNPLLYIASLDSSDNEDYKKSNTVHSVRKKSQERKKPHAIETKRPSSSGPRLNSVRRPKIVEEEDETFIMTPIANALANTE
jgi:serine/threonine protein kinase